MYIYAQTDNWLVGLAPLPPTSFYPIAETGEMVSAYRFCMMVSLTHKRIASQIWNIKNCKKKRKRDYTVRYIHDRHVQQFLLDHKTHINTTTTNGENVWRIWSSARMLQTFRFCYTHLVYTELPLTLCLRNVFNWTKPNAQHHPAKQNQTNKYTL